jgi:transposase
MGPYSIDLRKRIVEAYHNGEGSVRELAERFKVAPNTVQNYRKLEHTTGSVAPRPHGGGPAPKLDDEGVQQVRRLLEEKNDRTLNELVDELAVRTNERVSPGTVWRAIRRAGMTRKKKRYAPVSRSEPTFGKSGRTSSSRGSKRTRTI